MESVGCEAHSERGEVPKKFHRLPEGKPNNVWMRHLVQSTGVDKFGPAQALVQRSRWRVPKRFCKYHTSEK